MPVRAVAVVGGVVGVAVVGVVGVVVVVGVAVSGCREGFSISHYMTATYDMQLDPQNHTQYHDTHFPHRHRLAYIC